MALLESSDPIGPARSERGKAVRTGNICMETKSIASIVKKGMDRICGDRITH